MSPLLRLPAELLQHIIAEAHPDDFESLMLTCTHVFRSGNSLLAEHNTYKKLFRHIRVATQAGPDTFAAEDLADYLIFMARHPRAAKHVQALSVGANEDFRRPRDDPWQDPGLTWLRSSAAEQVPQDGNRLAAGNTTLTRLVTESPWLSAPYCDRDTWLARVLQFRGQDDGTTHLTPIEVVDGRLSAPQRCDITVASLLILLLSKLDGLQKFTCGWYIDFSEKGPCQHDPSVYRVLRLMCAAAHVEHGRTLPGDEDAGESGHTIRCITTQGEEMNDGDTSKVTPIISSPLRHLREVYLCRSDNEAYVHATTWDPLLTLPDIHTFYATRLAGIHNPDTVRVDTGDDSWVWDEDDQDPEEPRIILRPGAPPADPLAGDSSRLSPVQRLELGSCVMDPAGMAAMLARTPRLTTLRYLHGTQREVCSDWDVAGFIDAILATSYEPVTSETAVTTCARQGNDDGDPADAQRLLHNVIPRHHSLADQITDLALGVEFLAGGNPSSRIQSLHGFTALRRLEISIELFLDSWVDVGDADGQGTTRRVRQPSVVDDSSSDDDDDDGRNDEIRIHKPRLIDLLPRSLEELELFISMSAKLAWLPLVRGFAQGRAEKLPNLKMLRMRDYDKRYKPPYPCHVGDRLMREARLVRVAAQEMEAEYSRDESGGMGGSMTWENEFWGFATVT
ncbi:hypothetical protein Micbo1qcDRAFT_178671 [Microdochium bolleyi]|uniref:F-box domain-containing protein n=1 Tax=Microdochium bolleyi TaxID=196109 RepID=A0A136ISP8_9PEZI|nr:hypothetical protein Micbo1qcDRAFT_178671 [Microdochium bolleyi]